MKHCKSILCLILALAMLMSMTACGTTSAAAPSEKPVEATVDEAGSELVYAATFTSINDASENGLNPLAYTENGIYAQSWEKVGEREIPKDAVIHYEGEYDIYGPVLYFIGYDGSARKLEQYEAMPTPENTENRLDYYGSSNLSKIFVKDDGGLTALESQYVSWFDGPESERYSDDQWQYYKYEQDYYIRELDADGKELSCKKLDIDADNTYLDFYNSKMDENGNLLCLSEMRVLAFAPEGGLAYSIEAEEYLESIVKLRDGRLAVTSWGNTGYAMNILDTEKHALGESVTIPNNAYNFLPGGGEYDLYYQDGMNLYGFKLGDKEGTKVLNWVNVDVNGNALNGFQVNEDGSIVGLLSNFSSDEPNSEIVKLALVPLSSLPVKETISMAVVYLDYQVQMKIIDFNRHSDTTRIVVSDYSEYNNAEDYSAGVTKMTTEIMAGNLPDILSLTQLPYEQMAAKGLLEDLYPYLDADKELKREDFFPTVLKALEYNGGLYQVAPSFQIITLLGASSVVGKTPGWTYDEFNAALASMPAGCTPLDQYTTRDDILQRLLTLEMDNLVDWTTGKCNFDSQDYINILEFANRFQAEFDWEHYEWTEDENTEKRIADGRQMLMAGNIYSVDDLLYNDFYFGGDATYIGYPTSSGVGSMMSLTSGFALSSKCEHKDEAWAFLRTVLTEDYQKDIWGLPINIHAFNEKLEDVMTPQYETDAEGNVLLDENGEKKQISRGGIGMADGSVHEIYAMTQEQADKLMEVINTTTRVMNTNNSLINIATEEAQAFFAGQKSAEEVARLTQSKVNIYVNEQR